MFADDGNRDSSGARLTCKNMAQHDASYGGPVVFYGPNDGSPLIAGIYLTGGITPSSAARPKVCGIALAMVAVFCCFPGISMLAQIGRTGITNQAATGLMFISVAAALSVASVILFIRGRQLSRKLREMEKPRGCCSGDEVNQALLSNRDECYVENDLSNKHHLPNEIPCECDEVQLANRIAQSFTLSRYFDNLRNATGPFELDQEAMDKATEISLRPPSCALPFRRLSQAKQFSQEENSSTDSAIYLDSDTQSIEAVIVV